MLHYCNHCKEKSITRNHAKNVEYCVNKGCGHKARLHYVCGMSFGEAHQTCHEYISNECYEVCVREAEAYERGE